MKKRYLIDNIICIIKSLLVLSYYPSFFSLHKIGVLLKLSILIQNSSFKRTFSILLPFGLLLCCLSLAYTYNLEFDQPIISAHGQPLPLGDYVKYHKNSDFIKEFDIPIDNNEKGLKGITTDSKNNAWIYHNSNTSSTIMEFNPVDNTFTKYPISKVTNVDNAITNLAGGQLIFDQTRNIIWFSDARTNSLGKLNLTNKQMDLYDIPTANSGIMGIALSPDSKSIWFAEITGNNIGNFHIKSNKIVEYPTGESSGPTLITFDKDGFLWSSLSYSDEILRIEPWMLIPGNEFNGMLKIKLENPDRYSPFGLSIVNDKTSNNGGSSSNDELFVSDHGSSRIIVIPLYDQNILNEEIVNYTSYWTSLPTSNFFPNTLPSQMISDNEGNIYFAEHLGNRIAKFSTETKTLIEYDIPTGPLAGTVFLSISNDNKKVWFTEWESNKIGYLDTTKGIPYQMKLTNENQKDNRPIIFKHDTSYQTMVLLTREDNFTLNNSENLTLNNISLSVVGMSDSGPKGITYSFNPPIIDLSESNEENSLLNLHAIKDGKLQFGNHTLMIRASSNIDENNNLTLSILQPLPISIIKP